MEEIRYCRFCANLLTTTFIDLGSSPLSNAFLTEKDLSKKEEFYPLHVQICEACFLVQLPQFQAPEVIFKDYAYFSSYSDSWLLHCAQYVNKVIERFGINTQSQVIELASNDGYLLQYFKEKQIPVLGIEPAENVALVAEQKGVPTLVEFFGQACARKLQNQNKQADLIIANNVLAHVPDINDFVAGMKILLTPQGIITIEVPHLLCLIAENQFDTIYHEHFSYFSFATACKIFSKHGLTIFDVEEISVHGGSLRLFIKHKDDETKIESPQVATLLKKEQDFGLDKLQTYQTFSEKIDQLKTQLRNFLIQEKSAQKKIAAYGAPAKGNTLLNFCGFSKELISFTVDKNPYKQGRYLPGTHIPILHPDKIKEYQPDYLFILPWNLKNEIMEQMAFIKDWQGKFLLPIPALQVI